MVLVVAGSFAVQSHVLAVPPVLAMVAVGGVGLVVRAVRGPETSHARVTALLALGVGVVCWVPPVIEQFTTSPGNLQELFDFARHGDGPVNGWASGARVVSQALSVWPTWVSGTDLQGRGVSSIPWALIALVGATLWAGRRRWSSELYLCVTALVLIAAAFVGSSRVSGVAFPYLFRWVWVVGAVTWFAVGAVALAELRQHWSWARFAPAVLSGATVITLLVVLVAGPDLGPLRGSEQSLRTFYSVIDPTMRALEEVPGPTLVTITAYGIDGSVGIEVLSLAEDAGLDVRYPSDTAYVFGSWRTIDPADARSELVLASGPAQATYAADPRFTEVAAYDPLTTEERAEFERLDAVDWSTRADGPDDPGPEYQRYRELSDKGFESITVFISDEPPLPPG